MTRIRILPLVILLLTSVSAQQPPKEIAEKLTLVESPDAAGHIEQARLARVFWHLIREQKLQLRRLPTVMVLHVSPKVGLGVGIAASGMVRTDHCQATGENYYQLWLLGEPAAPDYVSGLQTILQHEFGLHPTDSELKSLLVRVTRSDLAIVDAKSIANE